MSSIKSVMNNLDSWCVVIFLLFIESVLGLFFGEGHTNNIIIACCLPTTAIAGLRLNSWAGGKMLLVERFTRNLKLAYYSIPQKAETKINLSSLTENSKFWRKFWFCTSFIIFSTAALSLIFGLLLLRVAQVSHLPLAYGFIIGAVFGFSVSVEAIFDGKNSS